MEFGDVTSAPPSTWAVVYSARISENTCVGLQGPLRRHLLGINLPAPFIETGVLVARRSLALQRAPDCTCTHTLTHIHARTHSLTFSKALRVEQTRQIEDGKEVGGEGNSFLYILEPLLCHYSSIYLLLWVFIHCCGAESTNSGEQQVSLSENSKGVSRQNTSPVWLCCWC